MSKAGQQETTVDEYLTKVKDDNGPGIVRPLFEENIKFEFYGQCIDELKENKFFRCENEDPHVYISNITDIVDLFHSPGVSRDQVMLMAFPFTLKGRARQGSITTWDLFKNAFLRLDTETRQNVDFKGPIPRMTTTAGIEAIIELS
ncbi:hypothetical protein Tco_0848964 [Tanacetum coccineum]